jgi:hypothetical protein
MGSDQWGYFVPYQADITKALFDLQQREFEAGRYYPAQMSPQFLPSPDAVSPGAQHAAIAEAREAADATGTCSILDMTRVGELPDDFECGAVSPLSDETLSEIFGTHRPTREMLEKRMDFAEGLDRGQGLYVIAYLDGKPAEILFTGFSYD